MTRYFILGCALGVAVAALFGAVTALRVGDRWMLASALGFLTVAAVVAKEARP